MTFHQNIDRLAALAHLDLTPEEKDAFATQIDHILGYMSSLSAVSIPELPVMTSLPTALREDQVSSGLDTASLTQNAPDWDAESHAFFVPKI